MIGDQRLVISWKQPPPRRRRPRTPCCGIGFLGDSGRSRSTKEENQPPVRAKVGATFVPGRK